MKIVAVISVTRDDGVTLSQEIRTETSTVYTRDGSRQRETKAQVKARFERMLKTAQNATLGR